MEFKAIKKLYIWLTTPFFYHKIKKMGREGEVLIVFTDKFGDMVNDLAYAKELKKESGKKICVLCGENLKKLVSEYDCVDKIITYPSDYFHKARFYALIGYNTFFHSPVQEEVRISYQTPKAYHGLNSKELRREYVFRVKHDKYELFKISNPPKVTAIENFDKIKEKVVVINPYAKSISKNAEKVMQPVADMLTEKGYIVFTNVVGKQKPLKGTKALNCPVEELYSICQECHAFVSLRSGITDLMVGTNCKMFVVYFKNKHYRFKCSLKNYRTKNIEEYFVEKASKTENLVKVAEDFICNQQ